jgi:glycosyltransferase involved in cell wall biosynthesis
MADTPPDCSKTPIALVYWGRLGAGAALMSQIAEAMARDARFDLYLSPSLNSELPLDFPAARLMPIRTFGGVPGFLARTLVLPRTIRRLVHDLKARHIRAVITIMPHVWGLAFQRAAKQADIRTVLIVHDADPHPGERRPMLDRLVRREMQGSDRIVTFSNHVADRLVLRGDVPENRIARLYHPIFRFGAQPAAEPHKPFRLLFFGRILPYKGVGMLLEAFARLKAEEMDISLTVVGRGAIDAPAKLMTQPGLTIRTGWVAPDAIGGILAGADAIALPYLEASQSGVVAAAFGAGLPVVATPVGGLKEQVEDGATGVLARGTAPGDFAQAIRRLVETSGLYETCKAGAGAQAGKHSPEHFAEALGDAILETIETQPRA